MKSVIGGLNWGRSLTLKMILRLHKVAGTTTPAAIANRSLGVRLEGKWSWELTQQPSELYGAS